MIFRALKGLEDAITVSVTHWFMGAEGWTFEPGPGVVPDTVNGARRLHEVYTAADPHYTGRVTVPVLWDRQRHTIVCNESADIIRMLNSAFDGVGARAGDYYPQDLRAEIDALNARIYDTVNNGVYKAGFATTQAAYEEAVWPLFDTLDWLEAAARRPAVPVRRAADRGGLAPVHHAGALRRRCMSATSSATSGGLSIIRTCGPIHGKSTSVPGIARDGRISATSRGTTTRATHHQPDRNRAGWPGAGFRRAGRAAPVVSGPSARRSGRRHDAVIHAVRAIGRREPHATAFVDMRERPVPAARRQHRIGGRRRCGGIGRARRGSAHRNAGGRPDRDPGRRGTPAGGGAAIAAGRPCNY